VTLWREGDDDEADIVCLTCLVRPPRPGSVYCSRLCRALHALRIVRLSWPRCRGR